MSLKKIFNKFKELFGWRAEPPAHGSSRVVVERDDGISLRLEVIINGKSSVEDTRALYEHVMGRLEKTNFSHMKRWDNSKGDDDFAVAPYFSGIPSPEAIKLSLKSFIENTQSVVFRAAREWAEFHGFEYEEILPEIRPSFYDAVYGDEFNFDAD